tara:strand:+ start:3291 stop:4091 length:801 start_codon:yes stop_codon:yes gene_type:complete
MPVNPTIFSNVSPGDTIEAEDIKNRMLELQRFLNGGIVPRKITAGGDFENSAFIKTQHIEKPEFYGSPHPRVEAISSDTVFRKRTNNRLDRYYRHEQTGSVSQESFAGAADKPTAWQPIEGMSSTVFAREDCTALVIGSFYVQDSGGSDGFGNVDTLDSGTFRQQAAFERCQLAGRIICETALFLDIGDGNGATLQDRTKRRVYSRGEQSYNCRRMNHSFTIPVDLKKGHNKLSYRTYYRLKRRDDFNVKHIFFDARNFVVDCLYR